jgi:hypothetical protein
MTPMLRQNGQRVVVTIASDGESSDGNVAHALRALQVRDEWKWEVKWSVKWGIYWEMKCEVKWSEVSGSRVISTPKQNNWPRFD